VIPYVKCRLAGHQWYASSENRNKAGSEPSARHPSGLSRTKQGPALLDSSGTDALPPGAETVPHEDRSTNDEVVQVAVVAEVFPRRPKAGADADTAMPQQCRFVALKRCPRDP